MTLIILWFQILKHVYSKRIIYIDLLELCLTFKDIKDRIY